MKGRSPTQAEKRFHDALCQHIGCVACRIDGQINFYCSVHHIDGRTKPWAHWLVLSLCAGHHQDGTGVPGLIAVHPWKTRFQTKYGRQEQLLILSLDWLEQEQGIVVPAAHAAANGDYLKRVA